MVIRRVRCHIEHCKFVHKIARTDEPLFQIIDSKFKQTIVQKVEDGAMNDAGIE